MTTKNHINLLSARFRLALLVKTRLAQWSLLWCICLIVSFGLWKLRSSQVSAAAESLTVMKSRSEPVRIMRTENKRMEKQLSELNSHQSLLSRLEDERVPFRILGLVSGSIHELPGQIQLSRLDFSRRRELVPPPPGTKKKNLKPVYREISTVGLSGVAADNIVVSRFVASLRDSSVFESVDLKSSVGSVLNTERSQSYLVECRF